MKWNAPRMWKDARCFIIGGGPSLPRQFGVPERIVKDVMTGAKLPSEFSPYMFSIHGEHVIGINNAYQIGDWIDALFFGDCPWYLVHRTRLAVWPGLKVTCCPRFSNKDDQSSDGIKYLGKDSKCRYGITSDRSKVAWNHNSGAAAISMAVHFGATEIILLGFDMSVDSDRVSHWHGSHHSSKGKERLKGRTFTRHLKGFPKIAEDAERLGIKIVNASPDSAITAFPRISLGELECLQK